MQINVAQLLQEPIGSTRDRQVEGVADIDNDKDCPVQGKIRLLRTDRGILVDAVMKAETGLTCSRCLSPFRQPLKIRFKEEFIPTVDVVSGIPLPAPEEGVFTINGHHILDLTDAASQYAVLAIPMKPLCGVNCAGLCPSCGQNLNQGNCNCRGKQTDPRWSKLDKLR